MSSAGEGQSKARGPLAGVVVADFSRLLAGPYATMLLGDLGADVVKVEHPAGDDARGWGPPFLADGVTSAYFAAVNRNKRSVVLDLGEDADRATARALVARSDVAVHNLRPDSARRFGLDAATLATDHPQLVTCDITAMGAQAPPGLLGNDFLVQAAGGAMSVTGAGDGEPAKVGFPVVDVLTGLHAAVGILAALNGGGGQHIETDLMSCLLSGMVNQSAAWLNAGTVPRPMGTAHPSIAPYRAYPAADGSVAIAAASDRQFRLLADAVGRPGLAADPRFITNADRVAHREALDSILSHALAAHTAAHWSAALTEVGVPAGPVQTLDHAFATAREAGLDPVVEQVVGGHPVRSVADPIRVSATPVTYRRPPPLLGEHTEEVRRWLADRQSSSTQKES